MPARKRRRYAEGTKVSVDQSQTEVRTLIRSLGADRIALVDEPHGASVLFHVPVGDGSRSYILRAPAPPAKERSPERYARETWRAIVLLVKSKAVAIAGGITTLEREFLADAVMPDGTQLIDHAPALIARAYAGETPQLTFHSR